MNTPLERIPDLPDFYVRYIHQSEGKSITEALEDSLHAAMEVLSSIPESKHGYAYQEGKWTIHQMTQHLIDAERVLAYRALTFCREENATLPGFEEDDYVQATENNRSMSAMLEELKLVRNATTAMFAGFTPSMLQKKGTANAVVFTVESLGYIIAGHLNHHITILNEHYL